MSKSMRIPTGLEIRSARRMGILTLAALVGVVLSVLLFYQVGTSSPEVFAATPKATSEPWIEINCLETEVEEGDDFRLIVNKKYDSGPHPHKKIRVFWYTDPITADASDYEHLYAERQASNAYQSEHGRMGRDFHTLEDLYPEDDETFIVRFNNSNDNGNDGECVITITDDDGVGIYDLEITSNPRQLPASGNQGSQVGYAAGDVIEITAHFADDVTTVNPKTGEQSNHAGLYIQVGKNRRYAPFLRNYGADALVFGYTVTSDDLDIDGISVQDGGPGTGLGYDPDYENRGIWITQTGSDEVNRLFHGLDDDPAHRVFQVEIDGPTIDPPAETDIPAIPQPDPPEWVENSVVIENGAFHIEHGELTKEDGGRDWFGFTATGGQKYIIEVEGRMELLEYSTLYVDDHLKDPSILEIVDEEGNQVMGKQDGGGFNISWARAYFTPQTDGEYYIAVGPGREDRGGLGHYTISVRQDDHADDWRTQQGVRLLPGESINGRINSDVAPGNTHPAAWTWGSTSEDNAVPRWGIESADDKDVIRLVIAEAGEYWLNVSQGPNTVGLWAIFTEGGNGGLLSWEEPVSTLTRTFQPGTYYVAIGTSYQSVGNTGEYRLAVAHVPDQN